MRLCTQGTEYQWSNTCKSSCIDTSWHIYLKLCLLFVNVRVRTIFRRVKIAITQFQKVQFCKKLLCSTNWISLWAHSILWCPVSMAIMTDKHRLAVRALAKKVKQRTCYWVSVIHLVFYRARSGDFSWPVIGWSQTRSLSEVCTVQSVLWPER